MSTVLVQQTSLECVFSEQVRELCSASMIPRWRNIFRGSQKCELGKWPLDIFLFDVLRVRGTLAAISRSSSVTNKTMHDSPYLVYAKVVNSGTPGPTCPH